MGRSLQMLYRLRYVCFYVFTLFVFLILFVLPVPLVSSNHFYPGPEARQWDRQPAGGLPAGASGIAARLWLQDFVFSKMATQK